MTPTTQAQTGRRFNYISKEAAEVAIRNALLNDAQVISPYMGRGREAVMNCIEACLRAKAEACDDYIPTVYAGPHPQMPHLFCFADNGDGMTAETVDAHLASYGYSGNTVYLNAHLQVAPFDTNKGIGVKATLLPKNPAGLEYVSLRQGTTEPTLFKLIWSRDGFPELKFLGPDDGWEGEATTSGALGLEEWDGEHFPHIQTAGHGTILTLWGSDPTGNTSTLKTTDFTVGHSREDGAWNYLAFLNRRFWDFQGVKVQVGGTFYGGEEGQLKPQQAKGAAHYLKTAEASGELPLAMPDGQPVTLRWYLMPARPKTERYTSDQLRCDRQFCAHGHFALKYQHECYWRYLATPAELQAQFRNFGIYTGEFRICLYLDLDSLSPDAQSKLTVDRYRERVYYNNLEITDGLFAVQMQQAITSRNPALGELLDYLDSLELNRRTDEEHEDSLRKLIARAGLLDNRAKMQDPSKAGGEGAATRSETSPPDAKPGDPRPETTSKTPRFQRRLNPRGSDQSGGQGWRNDLIRTVWKDEANGDVACEYTGNVLYFWRGWYGFEPMINHLCGRVREKNPTVTTEQVRSLVQKEVEHLAEWMVMPHIYRCAELAKLAAKPVEAVSHLHNPESLTALMVIHPDVEARALAQITRKLRGV